MNSTSVSLEVCEATVRYGAHRVLDQISLSASAGEFIALLGSSGCGKTTLLRAICGFVPLASGSIAVGSREISGLAPDKRNVAMVFQSYALWPHMTVAQNIGYGLKLRGANREAIGRRTDELLTMLRLVGLAERKVTALSGGQRQRVALGRALAVNPQILLLDEPLSNLDARIREDVRHEIKTLQRNLGITTVHVTHDRQEAMVMADRIAILDAGRAAQIGTPEQVYNHPNSPFVASFMGATNVMPLFVRCEGGRMRVAGSPFSDAIDIAPELVSRCALGTGGAETQVDAYFRSEDAKLCLQDQPAPNCFVLRGNIAQSSYPGGFYRYAVRVGPHLHLVDDERRFVPGDAVGIAVPMTALHLYKRTR